MNWDSTARPYLHLVDVGVSDNLGMRGLLDTLDTLEALHGLGTPTPLDTAKRIIVFVVNSLSTPPIGWDMNGRPPRWPSSCRPPVFPSITIPTKRSNS